MQLLFSIVQIVIGFNLLWPMLLFAFWKVKRKKQNISLNPVIERDFAIIVTAYQDTTFIPVVVESALAINYANYHIYVVADNCKYDPQLDFGSYKVTVLYPNEVIASNTGSHFYAINNFIREHDVLMITDSDNLLHKDILYHLNQDFSHGFEASQGLRAAKNLDTTFANLDAARDIYYHFYDGKVLSEIGSSATLAGSGMAFTVDLYKKCLSSLAVKGAGFDKVLQYEILKQNKRIAFNENAIIFDEKTSKPDQLVNQRARWINTWFKYFKFGFSLIGKSIQSFSFNQFVFGIVLLRPPLFIFLLVSVLFTFINLFINPWVSLIWVLSLFIFVAGFLIALKHSETDRRIYKALSSIPVFIYYQVISLIHSRKANQRSLVTKHNHKQN